MAVYPKNFAIHLYRGILKEHRNRLPANLRALGDDYIKNEFRLHKTAKEEQVNIFMDSWINYLTTLRRQTAGKFGINLDEGALRSFDPEQKSKLDELKVQARESALDGDKSGGSNP